MPLLYAYVTPYDPCTLRDAPNVDPIPHFLSFPPPPLPSGPSKSNLKVTSPEDAQHVSRRQPSPNGTAATPPKGDAKGSRTVPRRHTLGGARGSREILAMQPSDMDKKREAFLEHLKQKYPHHASAIMGHQERLREQVSGFAFVLVLCR